MINYGMHNLCCVNCFSHFLFKTSKCLEVRILVNILNDFIRNISFENPGLIPQTHPSHPFFHLNPILRHLIAFLQLQLIFLPYVTYLPWYVEVEFAEITTPICAEH